MVFTVYYFDLKKNKKYENEFFPLLFEELIGQFVVRFSFEIIYVLCEHDFFFFV